MTVEAQKVTGEPQEAAAARSNVLQTTAEVHEEPAVSELNAAAQPPAASEAAEGSSAEPASPEAAHDTTDGDDDAYLSASDDVAEAPEATESAAAAPEATEGGAPAAEAAAGAPAAEAAAGAPAAAADAASAASTQSIKTLASLQSAAVTVPELNRFLIMHGLLALFVIVQLVLPRNKISRFFSDPSLFANLLFAFAMSSQRGKKAALFMLFVLALQIALYLLPVDIRRSYFTGWMTVTLIMMVFFECITQFMPNHALSNSWYAHWMDKYVMFVLAIMATVLFVFCKKLRAYMEQPLLLFARALVAVSLVTVLLHRVLFAKNFTQSLLPLSPLFDLLMVSPNARSTAQRLISFAIVFTLLLASYLLHFFVLRKKTTPGGEETQPLVSDSEDETWAYTRSNFEAAEPEQQAPTAV